MSPIANPIFSHLLRPWIWISVLAAVLGGCASVPTTLNVKFSYPPERLVERSAGKVGVHYPPELRGYVGVAEFSSARIKVPLGEPSIAMFDGALAALFEEVVPLSSLPGQDVDRNLDLVLVPRIEAFTLVYGHTPRRQGMTHALIRYSLTLYSSSGEELAQWKFTGYPYVRPGLPWHEHVQAEVGDAIRNASAKLLTELPEHPVVASRAKTTQENALSPYRPQSTLPAALALLPARTRDAASAVACVTRSLSETKVGVSVLPESTLRDSLFPWMEEGLIPQSSAGLAELLKRPLVARRVNDLNLRYLVSAQINTVAPDLKGPFACGGGLGGAGCLGMAAAERSSKLSVTSWEIKGNDIVETLYSAESTGTSWIAGFLIPVWRTAPTEAEVCHSVATQMARSMSAGKEPAKD